MVTLWEEYPGTQSILIPAEGIAQECIISLEEAKICNLISVGIAIAPVAWRRIMLATPFLIGLYCDLKRDELLPKSELLKPNI